jgi:hypothetical protein
MKMKITIRKAAEEIKAFDPAGQSPANSDVLS